MALKDTVQTIKTHLSDLCEDLEKANKGNRTAAQRVRTGTVTFAKIAKIYRKESILAEKKEKRAFAKNKRLKNRPVA